MQDILNKAVNNKKIFGTSFCVKYKGETKCAASGNLNPGSQYFIASTTKLFVTSVIMHLRSKGMLDLDDKISKYLPPEIMKGLHQLNGKEYSGMLTIKNLLAHTSGLPDYFQGKNAGGTSIELELKAGKDRSWSPEEAVEYSKSLPPLFIPDTKGKAHYSDTNFQLLGRIIENITKKSFSDNAEKLIIKPLGMNCTYLYKDINDTRPKTIYFKDKELPIPKAMTSFGPDGGMVSASADMILFIEAFFTGGFFPKSYFDEMKVWNRVMGPLQSGIGIHRFKLIRLFDPFNQLPELIGHSGLSGAMAYYSPGKDLFIAGTVNQIAYEGASFRLALKIIREITKGK